MLGVSAETILRWVRRGELSAVRLPGGAVRFREDELDRWLADRATMGDNGGGTQAAPAGALTPDRGLTTGGGSSHG
jgi:excisionase family DNA binding protein